MTRTPPGDCDDCAAHLERRRAQILPYLGRFVARTGEPPARLLGRYLRAVHVRYSHAGRAAA